MRVILFICTITIICTNSFAQTETKNPNPIFTEGLKFNFNETGTHYAKLTLLNQVWIKYNENNPGSTIYGKAAKQSFDIGLRRTRMQLFAQLNNRVFIYSQFGMNNFNYLSARKSGAFFHDATCEYTVHDKYVMLGAGLAGWSGLARFSSPAVASILTLDAPLFEQATNDATDQFLRKLSMYAKGKISKLDYRIILTQPMPIQQSTVMPPGISANANFALTPPKKQFQSYVMWQFFDQESNKIAYQTGTYLGKKRVLNLGVGNIYQKNAMWSQPNITADTAFHSMNLIAIDLFYDVPLNTEKQTAISFYVVLSNYNFGTNYVRNLGPLSATNGLSPGINTFNGTGSAFPAIGTGKIGYAQLGYLLRHNLTKNIGQWQPFIDCYYASFERLKNPVFVWDVGLNLLAIGHNSKITLNYQNRPIFHEVSSTSVVSIPSARRNAITLQYQITF